MRPPFVIRLTAIVGIAIGCAAASTQELGVVRVTAARANIRSEASESAPVLDQVAAGAVFELTAVQGDWFRILLPPDPRLRGARVPAYLSRKVAVHLTGPEAATAMPLARQMSRPQTGAGVKIGVDIAGRSTWLPASPVRAVALPVRAASLSEAASAAVFQGDQGLTTAAESVVTWVWGVAPGGCR
ncbi:MAG TPA: SH3 domain-containing protein [Vicinamibacterales bacterium]|nr:SH3 domain-containing protein [Vicinamibacterales bacterium]